jgi:hypothetical protein
VNNVGDKVETQLSRHGRIANIPASEVEVVVDPVPPHRIRIRGRVDERMFYGPKLEMWTEVSTDPGLPAFRIEDTITNRGAHEQEYQLIYHCNFGAPLLGPDARFKGAIRKVTPFNAHAAKDVERYAEYAEPTLGYVEKVYCIEPVADSTGKSLIMLENAPAERGVAINFSVEALPCVTLWKNLAAPQEGYVTGLEPGTSYPSPRRIERAGGRVPRLAPGASKTLGIDVTVLLSREDLQRANAEVRRIQGGRETRIERQPLPRS